MTVSHTTTWVQRLVGNIGRQEGFGAVQVSQLLPGTGGSRVAAGATYDVAAPWSVPNQRTPADDPDWAAPDDSYILLVKPEATPAAARAPGVTPTKPGP